MKYTFPVINHINDILPHVEGWKEFVVADKGDYVVVNYVVQTPEIFSREHEGWEYRREARGITFYPDGTVAARKFGKFFNVNEREETQLMNIDLDAPHVILEKLDGSMITPFLRDESIIEFHTKMGKTEVADMVTPFIDAHPRYKEFALATLCHGLTPIFEFCSRKNRVVIDHPEDRLVLLAIRDNATGEYYDYDRLTTAAGTYDIELVQQHKATFDADFMDYVRGLIGVEGFVVRFDDGHMVKCKAEDYLKLHKAKEAISQEKNVWAMILDADVDDLKGFLQDEDRVRVEEFETVLWEQVQKNIDWIETCWKDSQSELKFAVTDERERKKHFAVNMVPSWPARFKNIAFKMYDGGDARELFLDFVRKNLGTGTKLDSIRFMFNDIKFNEQEIE